MASLVGYFAALLYNPNNVSAEASPVTTRLELEVAAQLARMIGHPVGEHWGHLCSGGTVANFEALWVARNLKYLPVALFWACRELGCGELEVRLPSGASAQLRSLGLWELLNLEPAAALDAADAFARKVGDRVRREPRARRAHPRAARPPGVRAAAREGVRRRAPARGGARAVDRALLVGEALPRARDRRLAAPARRGRRAVPDERGRARRDAPHLRARAAAGARVRLGDRLDRGGCGRPAGPDRRGEEAGRARGRSRPTCTPTPRTEATRRPRRGARTGRALARAGRRPRCSTHTPRSARPTR